MLLLAINGHAVEEVRDRAYEAGFDAPLAKPVGMVDAVLRFLAAGQRGAALVLEPRSMGAVEGLLLGAGHEPSATGRVGSAASLDAAPDASSLAPHLCLDC